MAPQVGRYFLNTPIFSVLKVKQLAPARPRTHTHSLDPPADTGLTISKLASRPPSTVCLAVRIHITTVYDPCLIFILWSVKPRPSGGDISDLAGSLLLVNV